MSDKKITIAIDGYSACGKSTLAKAMAKTLGYIFIDSGAMYRCVTLFAIENDLITGDTIDAIGLTGKLHEVQIQFEELDSTGNQQVFLNGKNVSQAIRSLEVANKVSEIASIKEVRAFLVEQQQRLGKDGGVIMDGRDIGSVVFPHAELKLFITASSEIRAERRFKELTAKGENVSLTEIQANLAHRDHLDTTRKESPLIQSHDAIVIDNSELSQTEQLILAMNYVESTLKKITQ